MKLASCACEELVLLRCHELLVVAAGAAQVGREGTSLVDDDDALIRSTGRASAVVALVLCFFLPALDLVRLVAPALSADRGDLDLFLATSLDVRLERRSRHHGFVVAHLCWSRRPPVVHTVEPLDRAHQATVVIYIRRQLGLITIL